MAASRSWAEAKFFCGSSASGIPRSRAKAAPPHAGRFVATATTWNPCSTRLRRFEPLPDTATPNLIGEASANHDPVRPGAANDLAHHLCAGRHVTAVHDEDHAKAHVEGAEHLVVRDLSSFTQEPEDRRLRPGFALEPGTQAFRQAARQVAEDSAAGDVGRPLPAHCGERFEVRAVGLEQLIPKRTADLGIDLA